WTAADWTDLGTSPSVSSLKGIAPADPAASSPHAHPRLHIAHAVARSRNVSPLRLIKRSACIASTLERSSATVKHGPTPWITPRRRRIDGADQERYDQE